MMRILSLAIDVIPAGILATIVIFLLKGRVFENTARCVVGTVFVFYLLAVFSLTGIPSVNELVLDVSVNVVPLLEIIGDIKGAVLNVLLFVPLGILLPLFWSKYRSFARVALFGLLLSLRIEFLQIFTFRYSDVNDLLTNTAGAVLGYLIAQLLLRRNGAALSEEVGTEKEISVLIGISLLIVFLIQPFISGALWNLFYT